LLERIRELAVTLPDKVADVRRAAENEGLDHPLITRLSDALSDRARRCRDAIDMGTAAEASDH